MMDIHFPIAGVFGDAGKDLSFTGEIVDGHMVFPFVVGDFFNEIHPFQKEL